MLENEHSTEEDETQCTYDGALVNYLFDTDLGRDVIKSPGGNNNTVCYMTKHLTWTHVYS